MRTHSVVLAMAALVAIATPAAAAPMPVAARDLDRFIGSTVHGTAFSDLGIVAAANRSQGTIAVVGPHGELATIGDSLLMRDGMQLRAPDVTSADVAFASYSGMSRVPLVRGGEVIIQERPF
jgi:hypothetical protein